MRASHSGISWLLSLLMLLNILLPLGGMMLPVAPAQLTTEAPSPFGDKILICTASGYRYISLEDFQNGVPPEEGSGLRCPLCVLQHLHFDKTFTSAALPLSAPTPLLSFTARPGHHTFTQSRRLSAHPSRAPPLSFS